MRVGYYPGCSLKGTARDYAESLEAVCPLLGVELLELQDWNCCGATAAHSLSHRTALNLAARNLYLAERDGHEDLIVPCPLCFNRLKTAQAALSGEGRAHCDVPDIQGDLTVWDLANFLAQDKFLNQMADRVSVELRGLKAVCYYGCMANRPPRITGEREYENPVSMDRILEHLGVEVRPWSYKTDCCGASHLVARPDIVFTLVGKLFQEAARAGANCIVVSCQMCQANLDLHQEKIMKEIGAQSRLPVLYFTELMGLALSHKDTRKWMKRHLVDPLPLIKEECQIAIEG